MRARLSLWIGIALFAAPFVLFADHTIGSKSFYILDLQYYFFPYHVAATEIVRSGHLPLWNPYTCSGMPLFGDAQTALLYPPNLLFFVTKPAHALSLSILCTFGLAGVGMFGYLRELLLRRWPAGLAALSFMFAGIFSVQVVHPWIATAALVPWIFWGFERFNRRPAIGSFTCAALAVAVQVFAGHPQIPVYCGIAIGLYSLTIGVQRWGTEGTFAALLISPAQVAGIYACGLLLSSVQLLPWVELARFSPRARDVSLEMFASNSLALSDMLTMLFPFARGGFEVTWLQSMADVDPLKVMDSWERVTYIGLLPLMLAIVGLAAWREPSPRTVRLRALVVVLIAMFGIAAIGKTPLAELIHSVPVLGGFRAHARATAITAFALNVLAAFGLQRLMESGRRLEPLALLAALFVPAVATIVLIYCNVASSGSASESMRPILRALSLRNANAYMPLGFAVLSAGCLLWFALRQSKFALLAMLAIVIVELGGFARAYNPTVDAEVFSRRPPVADSLKRDPGPYRIAAFVHSDRIPPQVAQRQLAVSWAMVYQIEDINGFNSLQPRRLVDFLVSTKNPDVLYGFLHPGRMLEPHRRALTALDVKYALLQSGYDWPEVPGWTEVYRDDLVTVIQNPDAPQRAFFAERIAATSDPAKALGATHEPGFDPMSDAIVEVDLSASAIAELTRGLGGSLRRTNWTPNWQTWRTQTSLPRLLVLSEMWFPGWVAEYRPANSTQPWRDLPIYRANYLFRGVPVPPGDNEVRFVYRPMSVAIGGLVTLLTAAMLAGAMLFARFRRARST